MQPLPGPDVLRSPGQRLRWLRQRRGWTQRQVADELGVAVKSVNRWEKEHDGLALERIIPIADLFDVDPRWLLTGEHFRRGEDPTLESFRRSSDYREADGWVRDMVDSYHAEGGRPRDERFWRLYVVALREGAEPIASER